MTGHTGGEPKTNSKGESHCFNCRSPSHWAYEYLQLSGEQQAQLHMSVEAQEKQGGKEQTKEVTNSAHDSGVVRKGSLAKLVLAPLR